MTEVRMPRLICIIGTDGSGKTTLSDSVAEALRLRGLRADRVWLGSESYLMAPLRRLLRPFWRRRQGGAKRVGGAADYRTEIASKSALAGRFRFAVPVYVALLWLDYRMQVALKRRRFRQSAVIIADRYLFDVAVNLGLTLGWSPERVVDFARRRLAGMELPAFRVFLRVEPEVSFSRKDDIPDLDYLRLRFSYYEAIARAFGFTERDGTLPIEANRDWVLAEAAREVARPYVIYAHANNGDVGGADKVLALMAQHMRDHGRPEGGARVAVCLRLATPVVAAHGAAGVPVILHPFVRPQTSAGLRGLLALVLRAPASLWFFWRLFGRERPDIVHVNDLYDAIPVLAARLRGISTVWHIRMIKSDPVMRALFAALVRRFADVSVSVSWAVRDHYGLDHGARHRAEVVHDLGNAALCADTRDPSGPAARPAGLPVAQAGRRLVLMVGRVEPWKGQDVFVEAVTRLSPAMRASHDFALVGGDVAGKEEYHRTVVAAAGRAGILCLGQRDDVPALMAAADVSVHASVAPDPFPGVVIESMLAGAATVATAAGGVVGMIRHGTDGLLYPPGDAGALAAALAGLLDSTVTPRGRFAAAARQRALALVDASVVDGQIGAIYAGLRGQRRLSVPRVTGLAEGKVRDADG